MSDPEAVKAIAAQLDLVDHDYVPRVKPTTLKDAAENVLRATDALRDAINGHGHPGEPHDEVLAIPDSIFHGPSLDCAACGGAQVGCEDDLNTARGDLREALGHERKPWEIDYE